MTNEEVICTWMERLPKADICGVSNGEISPGGWWAAKRCGYKNNCHFGYEWGTPILEICPPLEILGRLHEVEARLTEELWEDYDDILPQGRRRLVHLSAEQKITALGPILRPLVEGKEVPRG